MAAPPPLTCAGRVLQAASLPERGQGLAFGTRRGPGGRAGGHVASITSARKERRRAERVFGGQTVGGTEKTGRRRKRGRGERKDAEKMLGASGGGGGMLQSACVRACVCVRATRL